jgi:uncharacterized membrane protein
VAQILDSRFIRGVIAFLLTVIATCCGIYSVLLFIQVFDGHGSSEGNGYLFTFALVLLIFFPVAFAFAIHYWKSCNVRSGNQSA